MLLYPAEDKPWQADFSVSPGIHYMFGDDGAFDTFELYGGLSASFESIRNAPRGVDDRFTKLHLVPGVEYRLSEAADFVGEVGLGLNDDSSEYGSIGLAFYLR